MSQPWNDPRIDPVRSSTIAVIPTGSYAYGLQTERSDRDYGTVYIDSLGEVLDHKRWNVHGQRQQTECGDAGPGDVDRTDYPLQRLFALLHESSPSVIPMLWTPPEYSTPAWTMIVEHRDLFLLPKLPRAMFEYGKSTFENGFAWQSRKKQIHGLRIMHVGLELTRNNHVELPLKNDVRERLMELKTDNSPNSLAWDWFKALSDELRAYVLPPDKSYPSLEQTTAIWELCARIHEFHWGYKSADEVLLHEA